MDKYGIEHWITTDQYGNEVECFANKFAEAFSFALKIPKNSHFFLKTHARKTSPFMGGIECVSGCTIPLILEVVSCSKTNSRQD